MYKKLSEKNLNKLYLDECSLITWKIDDCSIIFQDPITESDIKEIGEVYINSKELIFKPQSELLPLYKFRYRNIESIEKMDKSNSFFIVSSIVIEIKRDGPPSNFLFHYSKKNQSFGITFVNDSKETSAGEIVEWINILKNILEQEFLLDDSSYFIIKLMISRQSNLLEMSNIESSKEKIILKNIIVQRIKPMEEQWGFLHLTNKNFYFQELIFGEKPTVIKISIKSILKIFKRRYQMEHQAVEIFTEDDNYYFNFKIESDRNIFYVNTRKRHKKILTNESLKDVTKLWINRQMSNFDYLMSLNNLADRSFCDLSQYPVFPWIIIDWDSEKLDLSNPLIFRDLSKPIGALNPDRLKVFKEKYDILPEGEKFLYGSHYSSPGYVNCYLLRNHPLYTIKMQSGKYDISDRMFHSIKEEWHKCYYHEGCVKELIPEFFMEKTDFLINKKYLNLGIRKDGQKVNDVLLPAWAKNAGDFLKKHREGILKSFGV